MKTLLEQKKFQSQEENQSKIESWQEYALKIIKDFKIEDRKIGVTDKDGKFTIKTISYKGMIFRYAKKNKSYLQGKVELCKEKWGENGIQGKGNYLISLFRKKRPWEK